MSDNPTDRSQTTDWKPQHYGRDDHYAYFGMDVARGNDQTAWRCFCGRIGVIDREADIRCDKWGCPAKEFLS